MKIGDSIQAGDDLWDDTLLIKAYEQSVKLQQADLAKQIARSTNKAKRSSLGDDAKMEDDSGSDNEGSPRLKVGDFVRATYEEDGVDYEARILSVGPDGDCEIQFIGYENEQLVAIGDLLPSWGEEEREKQSADAADAAANAENEIEREMYSHTKRARDLFNGIQFNVAVQPPPAPPMPPMLSEHTEEAEHMSAMLMAWYMSGYYTGLYQGQKLARQNAQKNRNK